MLVTFQVIGYALSKVIGIFFISSLNRRHSGIWIMVFIGAGEVSLILFGAIPPPYNVIPMFLNGVPLGMILGLIFSYIEGRRTTEILCSAMAISFVVSTGLVKSVGQVLLNAGCALFWMPAAVGAIFFIPLALGVFCLESLPDPSDEDIAARTERVPMDSAARLNLFKYFAPGIIIMAIFYSGLSAYRDFRDNFAAELWHDHSIQKQSSQSNLA
jgi:hypothetical protein